MEVRQRIKELTDNFSRYINLFEENNPFSGPSEYLYINKIVNVTKKGSYDVVFTKEFIEWIYATLASWGMHRMGPDNKGAKINDFEAFKQCIDNSKEIVLSLKECRLNEIEYDRIIVVVRILYRTLYGLMRSNSKLVATTKVMHFLLPHLVPPMDREYTMRFFNNNIPTIQSSTDTRNIEKEIAVFESTFKQIYYISTKANCQKFINSAFSPTVPKVIDNAIISYVKENLKSPKAN
jgi:hypothetical protein